MWVAKRAKANAAEDSALNVDMVLKYLAASGPCGKQSSDFLNREFKGLYSNTRSRIPLLRHVCAVILYDEIFEPFAVGLSSSVSAVLRWMEEDLVLNGLAPPWIP